MRVFLTGATGFIGAAIIAELIGVGHQVVGLTRSDKGAAALAASGAASYRGDLDDLTSLHQGAAGAEAVIHCGFDHDFSNFAANCEKDRHVVGALGAALAGTDRPLLITSGVALGTRNPGQPALESFYDADNPIPRKASEEAAAVLAAAGAKVMVVRLPQVHDPVKQGLISPAVEIARAAGVSAYVEDGLNRWPAAAVADVARLYRLVLEHGVAGARYHAVGEEGVTFRDIAEVIGRGLKVSVTAVSPAQAADHFGWLAHFVALDMPASSAWTQNQLGWKPAGPTLIADLQRMDYGVA